MASDEAAAEQIQLLSGHVADVEEQNVMVFISAWNHPVQTQVDAILSYHRCAPAPPRRHARAASPHTLLRTDSTFVLRC
jgi:hypothetical protein